MAQGGLPEAAIFRIGPPDFLPSNIQMVPSYPVTKNTAKLLFSLQEE
jgi:hypothetical protein